MICKFALVTLLFTVVAVGMLSSSSSSVEASPSTYRRFNDFHFKSAEEFKSYHIDQMHKELSKTDNLEGFWPQTVSSLNVTQYLGRWYQVVGNWIVLNTFSNNTVCPTATYGPVDTSFNPPHVGVYNWERQYSITGPVRNITGYATQKDAATNPGRLSVTLNGAGVDAPYWVFNLGPIVNGQYEWAIVSDYLKLTLFILVRDVNAWETKYEQEVLALAAKRGFTGHNAPIKVVQSPQCNYNRPN